MAFEGFNPTKKEREAIDAAYRYITENTRDEYRSNNFMKDEAHAQQIPRIAAKGNCVKWFLDGLKEPEKTLREMYYCRPAAIWFQGMGAEQVYNPAFNKKPILVAAVVAYDAAFKRMQDMDMAR